MRKISTTVYLEPDQYERLTEISKTTGVPVAVLVRRGIDREINCQEEIADAIEKGMEVLDNES